MKKKFSHLTKNGEPTMVDVSDKEISHRLAVARSVVIVAPEILEQFKNDEIHTKKGPVFQTAILAGIMASKKTSELIPLCHYNDLLKITFDASIGANEGVTKLSGASFVYLCAEAILDDGTVISVCDKTDKTALNFVGDDIWEITIWPKDIFALNFAEQISMITYNFQDQNGNNIVRDFSTGEDFTMFASCQ